MYAGSELRDGDYLGDTVADIARYFSRAIIMPNLVPPVDTPEIAREYRDRIISCVPDGSNFKPLMTLYITRNTSLETVIKAKQTGFIHAFKFYPAGATTNSASGVSIIKSIYPVFEAMQTHGMPLCIHGEVNSETVDIFDREAVFIDESLSAICRDFPELKIILEHITTRRAVDFVVDARDNVAATITAHHLLFNRNHMLAGSIKPLFYCLPVLKRLEHQVALMDAAVSGNPKFFLGTDSAPHSTGNKETACGCAGCYTAHAAIELYAEVFEHANALDKLEAFASFNGPDFYQLPRNTDTITLRRENWQIPDSQSLGGESLTPLRAGEPAHWKVL